MKLLIAAAVLAVASCSPQNVFTFTQHNPAGAVPFDQYWETFKQTHSKRLVSKRKISREGLPYLIFCYICMKSQSLVGIITGWIFSADKNYADSQEEEMRKVIFSTNLKKIEMHNYLHAKGLKNFRLGVNEYADMVGILKMILIF